MDSTLITTLGDRLYDAMTSRTPVAPLTSQHEDLSVADAYRIQQRFVQRRLDAGETVIGKKIGVTSKAVMDMLGVYQPDFGYLLSGMVYGEGECIPLDTLIQPKAEGEIAFVLKRDLLGPGVTNAMVLAATECVMPCFEIVDSRIRDWKIRIGDTVADNASCGVFVLGDKAVGTRSVDLDLRDGAREERRRDRHRRGRGCARLAGQCRRMARQYARPPRHSAEGRRSDPVRRARRDGAGRPRRQLPRVDRRDRRVLGAVRVSGAALIHWKTRTSP